MILRATGLCIQNDSLLLVRQHFDDVSRPWSLPGGKVEEGETIFDAVVREVNEETGIIVKAERLLYVTENTLQDKHIVHFLIECSFVSGDAGKNQRLQATESIAEASFVPLKRLNSLGFSETFVDLIQNNFPAPVYRGSKGNIGL